MVLISKRFKTNPTPFLGLSRAALEMRRSTEDTKMRTWVTFGGAGLLVYAVIMYISASTAGNVISQGDTLISVICAGVGVVLVGISFFMKKEEE